ncbi:hypothetical protein H4S01_000704 [Coemansia sp. RSA 2610]|nr:hypothetical protein H4S01_000704 [Coemansia sp. RSA 2610]
MVINRYKHYGNPFESNVLVRVTQNNHQVRSFFLHELPPNCPIDYLLERISAKQVMVSQWEAYVTHSRSGKPVVLEAGKTFADYGIRCWSCVYVRAKAERVGLFRACGLLRPRALVALGKRCFGGSPAARSSGFNAANRAHKQTARDEPRPYGYLRNSSSTASLFSNESLDYGAEQKVYIL